MKYIYLTLLLGASFVIYLTQPKNVEVKKAVQAKYTPSNVPQKMSTQEKKTRFYALLVPAVEKVHKELTTQYENTAQDIKNGTNRKNIQRLKAIYTVQTDEQLLVALKPHPQSIALAQAAMESAWATSRFFVKANNIFGIYSVNEEEPRIAASEKREGRGTIWLRKFATVEESVRAYYKLMAKGSAFEGFRTLRVITNDPHKLVKKLDKYSEIGAAYGKELSQVIKFNKLIKYDKLH